MMGPTVCRPARRLARKALISLQLLLATSYIVVTVGCGSTPSTPTQPTNQIPVITSLSVSPTFGVSGLTVITMTAVATDADNDPLTFTWSFGGATMTGATVTAKLTGDGTVAVQLTVTDGKGGSATDSRNVTIGTMTGTWSFVAAQCGTQAGEQPGMFTLTQTGTSWTGRPFWPEAWCNITRQTAGIFHDPGTIDDQGNFTAPRISVTTGGAAGSVFLDFNLIGKMDATGRKITGKIFQSGFNGDPFTLMKQ